MISRVLAIFVLSLWGSLLMAKPVPGLPHYSVATLRQAIDQQNFDRVERIIATAHEKMRQGKEAPDYLRNRLGFFDTTNPDTIAFVSAWRAHNPQSIYAKTAQAWVYFAIGNNVRGTRFNSQTYPVALEINGNMHRDAMALATEAFANDNTLVSAADAVIVLSRTLGRQGTGLEALDTVMRVQPNWGTLTRALDFTNRQYGGSVELAEAICKYYGPMIEDTRLDVTQACVTWASFVYHGHRRDEIRQWMRESDSSWYDHYRIQDMFRHRPATDEEISLAVNYFKNGTTTDLRLARKFDTYYSWQDGSEPIYEIVLERAKSWAETRLEHDPYNLGALKILLKSSHKVTVNPDGSQSHKPTGLPTDAQKRDYLRRRLLAAPYNADFWEELAGTVARYETDLTAERILAGADMRVNAIVYSNHSRDAVQGFLYQKLQEMKWFETWQVSYGANPQQSLNRETVYACPIVRSSRLLEQIIKAGGRSKKYSEIPEETQSRIAKVLDAAESGGYCTWERDTSVEDLYFEPVDVDLTLLN